MTNTPEISPDDPRFGFAGVTSAVRGLIDGTGADQLGLPTPCDDFTVKDMLNHINLVMGRVAAIGNGEHFSTVTEESVALDDGHAEAYDEAAHAVMTAWMDGAKLEQTFEWPAGELPGGPLLFVYTAELATHGWDLATATGQAIEIDDSLLQGALMAAKMLPADDRAEMPFDDVVDPGPGASTLLQIAGWFGRQVA